MSIELHPWYDEPRLPPVPLHVPGPLALRAERLVARAALEQRRLRVRNLILLPVLMIGGL